MSVRNCEIYQLCCRTISKTPGTHLTSSLLLVVLLTSLNLFRLASSNCSELRGGNISFYKIEIYRQYLRLIKLLRRSVSVRILLYTFVQSFKVIKNRKGLTHGDCITELQSNQFHVNTTIPSFFAIPNSTILRELAATFTKLSQH